MTDLLQRLAERAVGPPTGLRPRRDASVPAALVREAPPEPTDVVEKAVAEREPRRVPRRQATRPPVSAEAPEQAPAPRQAAVEPPVRPRGPERREEPVRVEAPAAHVEAKPPAAPPAPRRRGPTEPEDRVLSAEPRAARRSVEPELRARRVERAAVPEPAAKPKPHAERRPAPPRQPRPAVEVRTRRAEPERTVVEVPVAAPEAPEPEIRVTIGRLEVRAAPAPERPSERPSRPPVPSLEDYLLRRAGGGGR
jgi:hypothetical protein